ncbi:MAG TPA: hypothetical protein VF941_02655 [Clostridia bacterium]
MHDMEVLHCCYCKSVLLKLPVHEINRLNGLSFQCECCGHQNLLWDCKFNEGVDDDPFMNIISFSKVKV